MKLVRVNLPAYAAGCDAVAADVACDYPLYNLNKIIATSLTTRAPSAAQFIKNFQWTAEDQNAVSNDIVKQHEERRCREEVGRRQPGEVEGVDPGLVG